MDENLYRLEMKNILLIACVFCSSLAYCQIELSRQVIGSLGQSETIYGNVDLSSTVGESLIQTIFSDSLTLTQGFHQPAFKGFLDFSIEVSDALCPTSTNGYALLTDLVGCKPPYSILWSNGSTMNMAEDLGPGLYSVTVTTQQCVLTKTFEVFSQPQSMCDLRFFNAFSPNDDGTNDTWEIENIESGDYHDNRVEIYNRWGQLIWEGERYDNKEVVWKGLSNGGNTVPDATYYYIATVNKTVYKGFIELTR